MSWIDQRPMKRFPAILFVLLAAPAAGAADKPLLLQSPTVNQTHVVFAYADGLWRVSRTAWSSSTATATAK